MRTKIKHLFRSVRLLFHLDKEKFLHKFLTNILIILFSKTLTQTNIMKTLVISYPVIKSQIYFSQASIYPRFSGGKAIAILNKLTCIFNCLILLLVLITIGKLLASKIGENKTFNIFFCTLKISLLLQGRTIRVK